MTLLRYTTHLTRRRLVDIKARTAQTRAVFLTACLLSTVAAAANKRPLEIYFIDVEGGQSTLIVTPERQSLLIDTGWAGQGIEFKPGDPHLARDANRIVAAAHDARISKIDYLLITHFHDDHDGGVSELAQLMPIGTFIDHGSPSPGAMKTDQETTDAFAAYTPVRAGKSHLEPKPGDRLPLRGVKAIVVSSAGSVLAGPLPHAGQLTSQCQPTAPTARDPYENPRSTGIVLEYGRFRFLDVGDLSGEPLFNLVCPKNLIGPVGVYLVAHHGGPDVADRATFAALAPRVAIMNNGLKKGGSLETYSALHQVASLEDVWQLHRSEAAGDKNFSLERIANPDETTAYWIKLTADADGHFRILNSRTGQATDYAARKRR